MHQLPVPQGPDFESRNQLTEEEVDYFKKVHRIPPKVHELAKLFMSKLLEPEEVKFFRQIHSLAPKTAAESDSRPSNLTENDIAHFRRVHRLPDPTKESEIYKSKLTEQEVDYFRLVHLLPTPVEPEY